MKLIYEIGSSDRHLSILPENDCPAYEIPAALKREEAPNLPTVSETEISRHYTKLAKRSHGVNDGFYPLGSCTMKYNPKINDEAANLKGFTRIHPLQSPETVQGCMEVMKKVQDALCEIAGMDAFTLQPAAGAHGEFTGLLLIKSYHLANGDTGRNEIIVPDSAHGTNPASSVMCGFKVVGIPSAPDGCVDLEALKAAVGPQTAGLMLTNPNTVGIFDKNIQQITEIVHNAGGLCYYDGANLNAVMGRCRPGDMGFDVVHVNLHKTFSTPHGGGGPGAGPVGCKEKLAKFLPGFTFEGDAENGFSYKKAAESFGEMKVFNGNFLVIVRALAYILELGKEGILEASTNAVINANYMRAKLHDIYPVAYDGTCMHEFVIDCGPLAEETGCNAMDVAKGLLDHGIHPPTMYFPLIVHEALMVEPTETEPREVMDEAIETFRLMYDIAHKDPEALHTAPHTTVISRPDEVGAARNPILRYKKEA